MCLKRATRVPTKGTVLLKGEGDRDKVSGGVEVAVRAGSRGERSVGRALSEMSSERSHRRSVMPGEAWEIRFPTGTANGQKGRPKMMLILQVVGGRESNPTA